MDEENSIKNKNYIKLMRENITSKNRIKRSENLEVVSIDRGSSSISSLIKSKNKSYMVSLSPEIGEFVCSCKDYQIRGKLCKHTIALINSLEEEEKNKILKKIFLSSTL